MKKVVFALALILALQAGYSPAFHDFSKYRDQEVAYILSASPSVPTRIAAIRTLGVRGSTIATPYLISLCQDQSREIRTAAIQALGMIKAKEALTTYYSIVWSNSKYFTVWDKISAVWALGNYPETNIISLIDIMDFHSDFRVCLAAARSLQKRPEIEAKYASNYWQPILSMLPK